jgi:hypothetical protein
MTSGLSLARAASAVLLLSGALGCVVDPSTCLKDQHVSSTTGTCVPDCPQGQRKANGLCVSNFPNAIVSIGPSSSSGSGGRTGFCPVIVPETLSVHIGQVIEVHNYTPQFVTLSMLLEPRFGVGPFMFLQLAAAGQLHDVNTSSFLQAQTLLYGPNGCSGSAPTEGYYASITITDP